MENYEGKSSYALKVAFVLKLYAEREKEAEELSQILYGDDKMQRLRFTAAYRQQLIRYLRLKGLNPQDYIVELDEPPAST